MTDKKDATADAKGGKSKLVLIIVAVLVAALAGGGAWFFMGKKSGTGEEQQKAEAAKPPVFLPMDLVTVNLNAEGGEAYLQVGMTFQLTNQAQVDLFKLHSPKVKNRLLLLLSSKKASDISTVEGKQELAKELVTVMNEPFTEGGKPQEVTDVLFTSFVIQ